MLSDMVSIAARITALELAVIAVGRQELGDSPGHPFRGNQWTAGEGGSIKDIMDHVRNMPGSRGDKASDHVNPDDLKALGSAAAQLHDTNAYNEATANAPLGDVPHSMTVDGAKTEDAAMIREVRDNPQGAPIGTAQKVADYLERERGGSSESDRIDWNEVGRSEYVPAATAAEPEQRHGLAQDKHSYDSNDVETFSIDDDGTVTFGDAPGHPFRGNQYSGGGGPKETVGHATAVAKLVDSGRYPNADAARAAIENQMKDVHPNDRETVMNMMVNGVRDPVQSLGEHRDENASAVMDILAPTGTGTSGDETPREAGYDEGIMRADEAYTYVGGEVSNPTALRQDAEAELENARSDLNSTAEPGSPDEEAATYNEAAAEARVAFHQEMEKADGYMRPDMEPRARGTEPTGVHASEPVVRPGGNAYDHGAG